MEAWDCIPGDGSSDDGSLDDELIERQNGVQRLAIFEAYEFWHPSLRSAFVDDLRSSRIRAARRFAALISE